MKQELDALLESLGLDLDLEEDTKKEDKLAEDEEQIIGDGKLSLSALYESITKSEDDEENLEESDASFSNIFTDEEFDALIGE